jgi:aspartate/methionine/tyrosine aminotransferase
VLSAGSPRLPVKLANVCYDIRGPVLARARQMEEEGQRVIKLNIGNLGPSASKRRRKSCRT